jgi:DNA/RNA-binding domain of Phe-tRNA-synthetase-like protein
MPRFAYDPQIAAQFPAIVGGAIHAVGLTNGASSDALVQAFRAEQAATLARVGSTPLSEVPSLAAWRRAFRGFGVDPTAYRSAAEALLRRLTKQGSIPSINTLVDIGNLVSIRYALPVAVFDQRSVTGGTTVRLATGEESFTDLGSGERESPESGEVIFIDEAGLVSARRWCWRQSAESASGPETTEILVTVEGHHEGAADDVSAALADLETLIRTHVPPTAIVSGVVTATAPEFAGPRSGRKHRAAPRRDRA